MGGNGDRGGGSGGWIRISNGRRRRTTALHSPTLRWRADEPQFTAGCGPCGLRAGACLGAREPVEELQVFCSQRESIVSIHFMHHARGIVFLLRITYVCLPASGAPGLDLWRVRECGSGGKPHGASGGGSGGAATFDHQHRLGLWILGHDPGFGRDRQRWLGDSDSGGVPRTAPRPGSPYGLAVGLRMDAYGATRHARAADRV